MKNSIALAGMLFIELVSFVCLFLTKNQEHTIYPFLSNPDMTAWRNVVNPGMLNLSIIISICGIFLSFLLGISYFLKLRFTPMRGAFSIMLAGLIALAIFKILFLGYNLNELLQVSSSIKPCDEYAPHIKCSTIK